MNSTSNDPVHEVELQFAAAMEAEGLGHHDVVADGEFHSFALPGKRKKSVSYKLTYSDTPEGLVVDHRDGHKLILKWNGEKVEFTDAEREALKSKSAKSKADKKAAQERARKEANDLFYSLRAAPKNHPYLVRKKIKDPTPLRYEASSHSLVVPVFNIKTGEFQTIERISAIPNARKTVPKDTTVVGGCSIPGCLKELDDLNKLRRSDKIVIGEGWVTCYSIRVSTFYKTISARYSNNLIAVAEGLKERYPLNKLIVAGDNGNGSRDAIAAARAVGAKVAFPPEQYKDFNDLFVAEGEKAVEDAINAAVEPPEALPEIEVVVGQHAAMQDTIEAAMIKAKVPVLVRAGNLVQPIATEYTTSNGGKTTLTALRALTTSNLAYIITKHVATFVKYDGRAKRLKPCDPPTNILLGLLERGHWVFPRVSGIITAPTMRPDGTILDQPGFDQATQLWFQPDSNLKMPKIPDKPTRKDALAALNLIKELLIGFPFVAPVDRSVGLAGVISAVTRGAFDLGVWFLLTAHMAGTGKSFWAELISAIITGRRCPVITATSDTQEMEKRLGALLMEAVPIICLDNLSFNLGGDLLCSLTTQSLVKIRILGLSKMPECEFRGSLFANGNNVTVTEDMVRRSIKSNLDAVVENPEKRKFDFDPIERVMADRGKYIAAALTIARAYLISGASAECEPLASFSGWSRFVREPLIWLGEVDPVKSQEQLHDDDPERIAVLTLFDQWSQHLPNVEGYRVSEIIDCAKEQKPLPSNDGWMGRPEFENVRPEFFALLMEKCSSRNNIDAQKLGKWLAKIKGQVHSGRRLITVAQSKGHGNRWTLQTIGNGGLGG